MEHNLKDLGEKNLIPNICIKKVSKKEWFGLKSITWLYNFKSMEAHKRTSFQKDTDKHKQTIDINNNEVRFYVLNIFLAN